MSDITINTNTPYSKDFMKLYANSVKYNAAKPTVYLNRDVVTANTTQRDINIRSNQKKYIAAGLLIGLVAFTSLILRKRNNKNEIPFSNIKKITSDIFDKSTAKGAQPNISDSIPSKPEDLKSKVDNPGTNCILPKLLDEEVKLSIANCIGCKPEDLKSVIGKNELNIILSKLSQENYLPGVGLENLNKGLLRANLHIHTAISDGRFKVQELLDNAVQYADRLAEMQKTHGKSPEPLLISITDHDSLEGTQQAVKLIASNPQKYQNIKFVPGIEICTRYDNEKLFSKPMQIELLGYGFNPFDEGLVKFVNSVRESNYKYVQEKFTEINSWGFGELFSLEDAKVKGKKHSHIKYGGSPGFIDEVYKYVSAKFDEKETVEKGFWDKVRNKYENLFKDHFPDNKFQNIIPGSTPTADDVVKAVKNAGGEISLAHPLYLNRKFLKDDLVKLEANRNFDEQGVFLFLKDLKNKGVDAIEANYKYKFDASKDLQNISRSVEELGFYSTGGLDIHGKDIFIKP